MRPIIAASVLSLICCLTTAHSEEQTNVFMLSPGFTVRQLPVHLSNVNNLRFAPDGALTALGYDGRVHILRDTDGDGLEDADALFWDKSTISVPVGMAWSPRGLYVSSHGKVSLLVDTNHDGMADEEQIVATGWPPTDVGSGGVDATAVTLDNEGNAYFGLLTADYSNPYRVKDGVSHYDLHGKRGTIQKFSASTHQIETLVTGIRVPYALAFNRSGDLFVTDQEGETWCPDGNPLDELNHVIVGRNYGFPPRQEKYLPDLISEPPVVAFGPQHQSSCGLIFNEAAPQRKSFGPAWWEGDALVAGESRGKIWRVRLVKTPAGYIGHEFLIARLNMLTMDLALAKDGALYVTCHSGTPDWGTGPHGEGKIFKITAADSSAPQVAAAWAGGPMEVRVAFDHPIDPSVITHVADMKIDFGEFVRAGDRLEVLKPPYRVVNYQGSIPRGQLRIVAAKLSADHRTLILATDPHPQAVPYALEIPGVRADNSIAAPATIDVDYDLNGVEASWAADNGNSGQPWSGWLPHIDSAVNAAFTDQSASHEALVSSLKQKGFLRLWTRLALAANPAQLTVEAALPFTASAGGQSIAAIASPSGFSAKIDVGATNSPTTLEIKAQTGGQIPFALHASFSSTADPTVRPLPLAAFQLPWAPFYQPPPPPIEEKGALVNGDYENGRALFFGDKLRCSTCHRLRGQGALVGPDLSNLEHRDAASVLRDILEPSAMINPDYVAYNVLLTDGDELTGFVRAQTTDTLRLIAADGKERTFKTALVTRMQPSNVSLMPAGLIDGLTDVQRRDLLTFLRNSPPTRSRSEVEALLKLNEASPGASSLRPLNIVLAASKQDHGPLQHDYPAWQKEWAPWLSKSASVTVGTAWEWPNARQFAEADVMIFYFWNHKWSDEQYAQLDEFLERGGGLVVLHAATIADKNPEKLAERLGLGAQPGPTKYQHTPFDLKFVAPTNNVITQGLKTLHLIDEPYWPMFGDASKVTVLATTERDGKPEPMLWTFTRGKGRVFASIPCHYTWTWEDPVFQMILLRGLAWTANEPPSRFDSLLQSAQAISGAGK